MSATQRRVLLILALIGLVYFALFLYPNSFGARSDAILVQASSDEYVTYPNVVRILTPGKTFNETRANLFLYEDYHYGYPFYAISALALLPVRLVYGLDFTQHMQLNLLLLRQLISLLPMILAAGVLVYLQTRFQSLWRSVALFVFLLTVRGVVRNHIWWWHPDALAVLFVVLTLFFLDRDYDRDRDQPRLGRNFLLAALFCGLAIAIKLLGFFFFLTIAVYLGLALWKQRIKLNRVALGAVLLRSIGFVIVMMAVAVFSNPWLFSDEQRERAIMIQAQKNEELTQGYNKNDPQGDPLIAYSKGPQWWASTLEKWYAPPLFLAYLFAAVVVGCVWGRNRLLHLLILTWIVPYSIYLLYFVAVKPDHYWLPVMLPLFACVLTPLDMLLERIKGQPFFQRITWQKAALALLTLALVWQVATNVVRPVSGNAAIYVSAIENGKSQLQTTR